MIAIVTGASSGIGREFAYQIDRLGFDCIYLIARRTGRLEEVSEKLSTKTKVLSLDLLDQDSFIKIEDELKESKEIVGLLVNAAGLGYNDYFVKQDLAANKKLIDLNILAPSQMISILIPYMTRGSRIINVASVAGFMPQPKFASYAASKAYLISLSRALRRELRPYGINVCCLCPNPVDTEFSQGPRTGIKKYGLEDIHKLVAKALKKSGHADIITSHPLARLVLISSKILPHSFIMSLEKLLKMY